ncbi:MAG: hypothetical protein FWE57_06590 [Chitinispirillia bacterium]|nr:hypothetical protein [Chitinispirillia bacterium]
MQKLSSLSLIAALLLILQFCGLSSAQPVQEFKWGNVVMGGGGFVSAIITSKTERNLIYARTDVGGAYRWSESGNRWIPITDWLGPNDMGLFGIDALALDPQNPSRVYMLAGTEYFNQGKSMFLRSDDYGETFDTINVTQHFRIHGNGWGRHNGERLAVDPHNSNILFAGTRINGLWKTTDRGNSWSRVTSAPAVSNSAILNSGINFVLFDPNHTAGGVTARIYIGIAAAGSANLYVTDDAGESWNLIPFPTLSKPVMPHRAVLTPGGRFLYVTTANGTAPESGTPITRGAVLKYDTHNKNWSDISPEDMMSDPRVPDPHNPGNFTNDWGAWLGGFSGISINPNDSNHIIVATINKWKPQIWEGSGAAAWGDRIFATTDGGESWTGTFGDVDDGNWAQTSQSAPISFLYNSGFNWIAGESIHWSGSIEFDPFNPKRVFIVSGNGVYMADDFSPGSRFRWNFTVRGFEETVPTDMVSIPGGPLITAIKDYDGFVHDDITRPVRASRHQPQIGCNYGIDFAKLQPNIVVRVGGDDRPADHRDYRFPIFYSQDTGRTWTKFVTAPEPGRNYKGKVAVSSDGRVVIWTPRERNTVLRTADWGATWTTVPGLSPQTPHPKADPLDPSVFYIFGGGVHRSNDTGKTFTRVTTGVATPFGNGNFDGWTNDMQVTPGVKGHIWVVGHAWDGRNGGYLARSVDGGETFHHVDPAVNPVYTQRVQHAQAIGFGKAAEGADYPAIYICGTINDQLGIWQSIDEARSWVRIDDEKQAFGALANGNFVRGDMNTFGVVYRSTAGRGVAVRMPAEWADNQFTSARRTASKPHYRPANVKFTGNVLTLNTADGPLNVRVYDLKGRVVFNKTYTSPAALKSRDLVRSKGSYIISVRGGAAKEPVFSSKMTVIRN